MSWIGALLFLATQISCAEALYASDPIICYSLDVILLLYSIIFTALYFREKFTREGPDTPDDTQAPASGRNPNEPVYTDLDLPQVGSDYQELNRPIRRREEETHYQALRGQTGDEYQQIRTKPRKGKKPKEAGAGRSRATAESVEMNTLSAVASYN